MQKNERFWAIRPATQLGFAVFLKYFQQTGRFPGHKNELPGIVITYLATQVDVDAAVYLQYDWQGRTIEYHRAQTRAALGFREARVAAGETMSQWLAEHVSPMSTRKTWCVRAAISTFVFTILNLPSQIGSHASFARPIAVLKRVCMRPPQAASMKGQAALNALLVEASPPEGDQVTDEEPVTLHTLRMDPGQVGVETVLKEVAKLRQIRALGLPKDLFSHLSPKVLRSTCQCGSTQSRACSP